MSRKKNLLIVLLIFGASGCIFKHPSVINVPSQYKILDTAQVLNAHALKEGGNLLMVPFKAGVGVEASDELDKLALMIIRGAAQTLENNATPYRILDAQNASQAQMVMQGYVLQRSRPGGWQRWFPGPKEILLKVEGRLTEGRTGALILHFIHQKRADLREKDEMALAEEIGRDIGKFLVRAEHRSQTID